MNKGPEGGTGCSALREDVPIVGWQPHENRTEEGRRGGERDTVPCRRSGTCLGQRHYRAGFSR